MKRVMVEPYNVKIGRSVIRGKDWMFNEQDHCKGKPSTGVLLSIERGWAIVKWKSGRINVYRIGGSWANERGYDLYYADYDIIEVLEIFNKLK